MCLEDPGLGHALELFSFPVAVDLAAYLALGCYPLGPLSMQEVRQKEFGCLDARL